MEESSQGGSSSSGFKSGKFNNTDFRNSNEGSYTRDGNMAGGSAVDDRKTVPLMNKDEDKLKLSE